MDALWDEPKDGETQPEEPLLDEAEPDKIISKVYVEQLAVGDQIDSSFVIHRLNLREYDRGSFLTIRLGDKTGKVNAVLWNNAQDARARLNEGELAVVVGKVGSYQGEMQITLDSIRRVDDPSEIDPADYLPASQFALEDMVAEFDELVEAMADDDYKTVIAAFRNDEERWSRFIAAPGAKLWHHPYLHGLLEHTLSVMRLCRAIAPNYPRVDADLLLTGAIFHDAGKMDEFVFDYRIDYKTDGRLLTHVYMGASMLERYIDSIEGFPADKKRLLLHLILSHHGETPRSLVVPMTLEASLLHYIENMDAQMAGMQRELDKIDDPNQEWTGFVKLLERYLYRGPARGASETPPASP